MSEALLRVENLKVHYPVARTSLFSRDRALTVKAVDDVSFEVFPGEALGIVGESGCGKSTLGRAILNLVKQTDGRILWLGRDIAGLSSKEMRPLRKDIQIVFQDPLASHNPRMSVGRIIGEPLELFSPELNATEREAAVREMMAHVGLNAEFYNRYPHELSGGQSQRVSIARAMILKPRIVLCDEPVSALDVSTQAQIVNLIRRLKKEFGVAIIFISHDLSVVRRLCERVMVMYLGKIMEIGPRDVIFENPRHPYTQALISAVPIPDPIRQAARPPVKLTGEIASPIDPPSGCVFHTRCPKTAPPCRGRTPYLEATIPGENRLTACHFSTIQAGG
ncbi:ABC transporter ATP-binding protein [Brevundimonas vesicularis]|uniref:ABC transporter ATP-binding protein n=1 Tax=Brevundimonas vesicularis TaxID=41276 RepID=UPI0038D42DD8